MKQYPPGGVRDNLQTAQLNVCHVESWRTAYVLWHVALPATPVRFRQPATARGCSAAAISHHLPCILVPDTGSRLTSLAASSGPLGDFGSAAGPGSRDKLQKDKLSTLRCRLAAAGVDPNHRKVQQTPTQLSLRHPDQVRVEPTMSTTPLYLKQWFRRAASSSRAFPDTNGQASYRLPQSLLSSVREKWDRGPFLVR